MKTKLSKPDAPISKGRRGSASGPSGGESGETGGGGQSSQFFSHSACSSPISQRRSVTDRRASEKGSKRKLTMFDLKTFVETKLLSKSEKMLEKVGGGSGSEANGVSGFGFAHTSLLSLLPLLLFFDVLTLPFVRRAIHWRPRNRLLGHNPHLATGKMLLLWLR